MSRISIVTPTLGRPAEIEGLLENIALQKQLPEELIIIDGAPEEDFRTSDRVARTAQRMPYRVRYIRRSGGTAIQRNEGIDAAVGDYVAFVDDDIRLEPDFFVRVSSVFEDDLEMKVGGVAGYITNQYLDPETSRRWRLYRRLGLFTTYEPGRYDYIVGYPINRYLQPPHDAVREIDFMGAGCAVWRAEVFRDGLRFDEFFSGFGVLEDAHLALRARRKWNLVEDGKARCLHLKARSSRENGFKIGRKTAVNYRYVFLDIVPRRSIRQEGRFWLVQVVDLVSAAAACFRGGGFRSFGFSFGKLVGMFQAAFIRSQGGGGQVGEV